jgi:hypothetical protein
MSAGNRRSIIDERARRIREKGQRRLGLPDQKRDPTTQSKRS